MKKYGVRVSKTKLVVMGCCGFDYDNDDDGKFGVDDINRAYKFIEHCDDPPIMEIFEKQ